jgi:uncharacterized protein (TIGR03086 family)
MDDLIELIQSDIIGFTANVQAVPDTAWDNPTPCDDWTVRDVVNYMTAEHLRAPRLLAGETIEDIGSEYDGDVLGDDPVGSWRAAADRSRAAWAVADLDRPVHLATAVVPTRLYGEGMLVDLAVHRWDVQRGAGTGAGMDGATVEHILARLQEHPEDYRGMRAFKHPIEVDSDMAHDHLLALLGRDPFWKQPEPTQL